MKPFVAIGGVLDNLFFTTSDGISVDDCAKTENLYSLFEAVPGPGTVDRAPCPGLEPLRTD